MDIVLHLGAHRSATTTFQGFLRENVDQLRHRGLRVWTPQQTRHGLFDGLIGGVVLTSSAVKARARATGRIQIALRRMELDGVQSVLVSEENMIGAMRHNIRSGLLYPAVTERLGSFRQPFSAGVRRIGFALRSYDSYWASALSYAVANGHEVPDTDRLDRLVTQPRRWRDVIADICGVFPEAEVVVWRYEDLAGDPRSQLGAMTDAAIARGAIRIAEPTANQALSCRALRRILQDRGEDPAQIPQTDGPWMPFDAFQQEILRAQYADDWSWIKTASGPQVTYADQVRSDKKEQNQRQVEVIGTHRRALSAQLPGIGGHHGTQRHMV